MPPFDGKVIRQIGENETNQVVNALGFNGKSVYQARHEMAVVVFSLEKHLINRLAFMEKYHIPLVLQREKLDSRKELENCLVMN